MCSRCFCKLGLSINWNPGKTEILVSYRGKLATIEYAKLRLPSGQFGFDLGDGIVLHAVAKYKHLGGILQSNLRNKLYASRRAVAAMGAYTPIAGRAFGAVFLDSYCKFSLLRPLVKSTLLCLAHTKVLNVGEMKKLNVPYMRVIRKIMSMERFDENSPSDLQVRMAARSESLTCCLMKARLSYFARLARKPCHILLAMLSITFENCGELLDQVGFKSRLAQPTPGIALDLRCRG